MTQRELSRKVILLTGTESTRQHLSKQLEYLIEQYAEVKSYALDLGVEGRLEADVFLLSTHLIQPAAEKLIPQGAQVLVMRRMLNIAKIQLILEIPMGSRILLVNDVKETVQEVMEVLIELGLNQMEYIPYYIGCTLDKEWASAYEHMLATVQWCITPGEAQIVPRGIPHIIDIGPRNIDISSIVEVLGSLGLLDERSALISARYFEDIVRLVEELVRSREEGNRINSGLNAVLNGVHDGILEYTTDGKIQVFNRKLEDLSKVRVDRALGGMITEVFPSGEVLNFLIGKGDSEQVLKLAGSEVSASRFVLSRSSQVVCTFRSTRDTLAQAQKVQQSLVRKGLIAKYRFSDIIGDSALLHSVIATARKLAVTGFNILIQGESGTGKELFASAMHNVSSCRDGPFLAVNFSALPEELVESELFGYEEGAFTGARKGGKIGLFEQAIGGTLFLDEIGDTSPKIQARLLRVLQEKEIMRVGGTEIVSVNVRIIAATNRDLRKMTEWGEFREDLYYRLKRLFLTIPPLRERQVDIAPLVDWFTIKKGRGNLKYAPGVREALTRAPWPGNVRELENAVEHILAVCEGEVVHWTDLPADLEPFAEISRTNLQLLPTLLSGSKGEELLYLLRGITALSTHHSLDSSSRSGGVGRQALVRWCLEQGRPLSEDIIRKRAQILFEAGWVDIGRGRQGMHVTGYGLKMLQKLGFK